MYLLVLVVVGCQVDFDVDNVQRRELVNFLRGIALYKSYYRLYSAPRFNRTIPLITGFIQRHAVCVLPILTSPAALSYRPCSGHRAINSHRVLYAQSDATRAGMTRSGMTRSGMTRSDVSRFGLAVRR